jgi:hypothetical protein
MYILIARKWQEITRLLPLKAGLSILLDPELHRIQVVVFGQGLNSMQQVFTSNTYHLMQQ